MKSAAASLATPQVGVVYLGLYSRRYGLSRRAATFAAISTRVRRKSHMRSHHTARAARWAAGLVFVGPSPEAMAWAALTTAWRPEPQRRSSWYPGTSSGNPAANAMVRYEVTGGTPASFFGNGRTSVEIPTDENGRASVQLVQDTPGPGATPVDQVDAVFQLPLATEMTWAVSACEKKSIGNKMPVKTPGVRGFML